MDNKSWSTTYAAEMQIISNSKNTDSSVKCGHWISLCPKAGGRIWLLNLLEAGVTPSHELSLWDTFPLCPCYLLTYTASGHCKTQQVTGKIKNVRDIDHYDHEVNFHFPLKAT